MAKSTPAPKSGHPGSLVTPALMGGIVAGKGFDFQTKYAVCHLPIWLKDPAFSQLLFEGTGDIDVKFEEAGKTTRTHIQTKDHNVTPGEFREVVEAFQKIDDGMPGTYQRFTLACPTLSAKLRPVEAGLARLRKAAPFYNDNGIALVPTRADVDKQLKKHGLNSSQIDFVHRKVFIEVGYGDLMHNDRALETFVSRLLTHPEFKDKLHHMVQPAFAQIMTMVGDHKGAVLERSNIEQVLRSSVLTDLMPEKAVTVWVHNWTKEIHEPSADFEVDWSVHFDRQTRKLPSADQWNQHLLPELAALRQKILSSTSARTIRFRGKCALSAGIAFGAAFPLVAGWTIEIPQPPDKKLWRSDALPTPNYDLRVEIIQGDPDGIDLVVGLNIRGDGRKDILDYVGQFTDRPKQIVLLSPPITGSQSVVGAEDACALARRARDLVGDVLKSTNVQSTRLFYFGPLGLAVFLGQHLTSMGEVKLYEFQQPSYVPSCTLST